MIGGIHRRFGRSSTISLPGATTLYGEVDGAERIVLARGPVAADLRLLAQAIVSVVLSAPHTSYRARARAAGVEDRRPAAVGPREALRTTFVRLTSGTRIGSRAPCARPTHIEHVDPPTAAPPCKSRPAAHRSHTMRSAISSTEPQIRRNVSGFAFWAS